MAGQLTHTLSASNCVPQVPLESGMTDIARGAFHDADLDNDGRLTTAEVTRLMQVFHGIQAVVSS